MNKFLKTGKYNFNIKNITFHKFN